MCVIAIKPKDIEIPSEDKLKAMWDTNSDGAGFMYHLDDSVYIEKGFMIFDDLKRALEELKNKLTNLGLTYKDIPMVMHFRITTHGGTSPENTHPFPVTENEKYLRALDVKAPIGLAHNGVISSVDKEDALSDTQIFIRDIIYPLSRTSTVFITKYEKFIKASIGWSRLAFLDKTGKITTIGDFKEPVVKDGLLYSNLNHYTVKYPIYQKSSKSKNSEDYYYDDEYEVNWYKDSVKKESKTCDDLDEDSLAVAYESFIIGAEYKYKKSESIIRYKLLSKKIYPYRFSDGSDASSYFGTFLRLSDNTTLTLSLDMLEPVVKFLTHPFADVEGVNRVNAIGGNKNKETAKLKQSANRVFYVKHEHDKLSLVPLVKDTLISHTKQLFPFVYNSKLDENKIVVKVESDSWFYSPLYKAVVHLEKNGDYLVIDREFLDRIIKVDIKGRFLYALSFDQDNNFSENSEYYRSKSVVVKDVSVYYPKKEAL